MVKGSTRKYDKYKHSAQALQKGGKGKAGKGTWGDANDEARGFEGQSTNEIFEEEYEEEVFEEEEPEAPYEVQIWNIPKGYHDEIERTFELIPGFHTMTQNRNRRIMFAHFDTLKHAEAALPINNTKFGNRYIGVRFSNLTSDWLLEQEQLKKQQEEGVEQTEI